MTPSFQFDQLYVISDLHFGGQPGFQIFGSRDEMLWFLDHLGRLDPDLEIALVINGDFIDFLAEAPALHFDPEGALAKLERIALQDPTFSPIFSALRQYVRTPHRHLIINLGNHDLELALPWVNDRLRDILTREQSSPDGIVAMAHIDAPVVTAAGAATDTAQNAGRTATNITRPTGQNTTRNADPAAAGAASRLHMVFDGSGVLAGVGGKSVLCVHGNEVDRWNPADFETLRQIGRDMRFGRPVEPWIPNAGSKMVIEVMNPVKQTYPFVDLLKPELDAVVPVLLACDAALIHKLDDVLGVLAARASAAVIKPNGMLGSDTPAMARTVPESNSGRTAALMAQKFPARHIGHELHADSMMQAAEAQARQGTRPADLVQQQAGQQLGGFDAVMNLFRGRSASEILREALEKLDQDRSFELADRDDTFKALDQQTGSHIDFLIAGHTHLERAIPRSRGRGYYYNSGTWVRLIRLNQAVRQSAQAFEDWFNTLKHGTMATLDARPDLIKRFCSVVVIQADRTNGATGELRHIGTTRDAAGTASFSFETVAGSVFPRS